MGSLNSYRFIGTSDDLWRAGINTTDVRALASRREETGIRGLGMHRIKKSEASDSNAKTGGLWLPGWREETVPARVLELLVALPIPKPNHELGIR